MTQHVWYAAYGSNLSRGRFDIYLRGGTPDGATHRYPGCRNRDDPVREVAGHIDAQLCFGGYSQTWGGGVAFVREGTGAEGRGAKARFYLLTLEQFEDLVAQENWLVPGSVVIQPALEQVVLDGDHTYRVVLPLGTRDDLIVMTVSQLAATEVAQPTDAYLRHVADGLREAHGMSTDEIVAYLASAPGAPPPDGIAAALS